MPLAVLLTLKKVKNSFFSRCGVNAFTLHANYA